MSYDPPHGNHIIISPDARWVIICDGQSLVRVWDIPSGNLIDWFIMPPITAIDFSPRGDFLATSHGGEVGVYLWSNKGYFGKLLLKETPSTPLTLTPSLPVAMATPDAEVAEVGGEVTEEVNSIGDLITLSGLPPSSWAHLSQIDLIKVLQLL
jgi:U3 small nucleolar RNA-associated protein 21